MESQRFRRVLLALGVVLAAGCFLATRGYWVAADPGVDENAYLVSGKLLARTGSPGFTPADPYSLVGKMWIGTREGRFYPKYPLGQPLLVALAVKTAGLRAAYWINPLLMTLALLGVFRLGREIAGSFAGLLAMIAMAASPATLNEVNDPDSHASSLCCTTWGMLLLLRWWRTGKLHHAALAGLLLGYSAIIRYTEGLLLLPVALAVLFRCRQDRRALGGAAALAAGWLAPVAGQVLFNLRALHSLTGYDTTHESTAFSLAYFVHNALPTARLLFTLGLPILLFLGVLGLAPPGSAVFGIQDEILHLQFAGDYRLYSRNLFVHHFIAELGRIDGRAPNALQPERAQALFSRLRGRSRPELARLERDLMAAQLRQGRRVFLLSPVQNQHWLEFAN